jgi:ABC-type oligopeptide transport system ATPase subunit
MFGATLSSAIHLKRVTKWFATSSRGRYIAVKDITLSVESGTFLAVVGPSGCGKSTLLNMTAGLTHPTEGYRDERTGQLTKDYSYKKDLLKSFVAFDPKTKAPDWVKDDPQRMLNAAVAAETRKDSREGQQIIVGVIHELGPEKSQWMLNDFIREQLTRGTGRVVFVNIHGAPDHGDHRNSHAHLLLMPREIGPDGFGKRLPALTPADYDHIREKWAEKGAKELRKAGYDLEADRFAVGHLELPEQREAAIKRGDHEWAEHLNRKAQKHRGPAADAMERKGRQTERGDIYRDIEDTAQLPALKTELHEIQKEIRLIEYAGQEDAPVWDRDAANNEWLNAVVDAAVEKEKAERRFVDPPRPEPGTAPAQDEQKPEDRHSAEMKELAAKLHKQAEREQAETPGHDDEALKEKLAAFGFDASRTATLLKWRELEREVSAGRITEKDQLRDMALYLWQEGDKERRAGHQPQQPGAKERQQDLDRDR